jgi:hypothetical protein
MKLFGCPFRKVGMTLAAAMALVAMMTLTACGSDPVDTPDTLCQDGCDNQDLLVPPDVQEDDAINSDIAIADVSTDTTVVDETALELVAQGKARLSAGESLSAIDSFSLALDRVPGMPEAEWGMALARLQSSVSMWSGLIGLIKFSTDPDAPIPPVGAPTLRALEWSKHEGTIGNLVDNLYAASMEQKARLDVMKAQVDNPVFTLEGGLPLYMGDKVMMNLCCDWDRSEIYAISSFNNLMLAFVSFLGSQNTDVVFDRFEYLFKELPGISYSLTAALEEFPDFFTLLPEGGSETWLTLGTHVANSATDCLESVRLMEEGNDLAQNVATLTDDEKPHLLLHGTFPSGDTEFEILWDGTAGSLKDTVVKVKSHLAGDPDTRLSLDTDVLVAIGVLVDIINRTVGIETLLTSMGFNLPDIVTGLIGSLDKTDPEQLVGLLGSILPLVGIEVGTVEIDLATFFQSPFNVRDFFPNYGAVPGSEYKTFLKSFECIKGGTTLLGHSASDTITVYIQDSSVSQNEIVLTVNSYSTADGTGDVFDTQTATLLPVAGFTGMYSGTFELLGGLAPDLEDVTLIIPDAGSIKTTYTSAVNTESTISLGGNYTDGFTPWDYGAACAEDTLGWDSAHFGETEFASAIEVVSPRVTRALEEVAGDDKASLQGFMAFKSPSFDGLLWIKQGETFAVADQAGFSTMINNVLTKLGSF